MALVNKYAGKAPNKGLITKKVERLLNKEIERVERVESSKTLHYIQERLGLKKGTSGSSHK